jgi:uncharacterized delta-60 repeat protein
MVRAVALVVVSALAAIAPAAAGAATATTVVTATVPSATQLDASGCDSGAGSDGVLGFGNILPNAAYTTTDCPVTFGSSNDTSMLKVFQADGAGTAMWSYGTGALAPTGTFGTNGKAYAVDAGNQYIYGASQQRDGRIVATGTTDYTKLNVVRWNSDGTLDTTFDGDSGTGNGIVDITPPDGISTQGLDIQQDSQGRLDIAVRTNSGANAAIVRLLADGRLDTSFGGDGFVNVDSGQAGVDVVEAISVQPDDKVIISGCTAPGTSCGNGTKTLLIRVDVNGNPDTTFDGDGIRVDDFGATNEDAEDVKVDPLGRIVGAGTIDDQPAIMRWSSTGALDTASINAPNGFRRTDVTAAADGAHSVGILRDGSFIVAGSGNNDWFTVHYTAAGALDTTYGTSGWRLVDFAQANDGSPEDVMVLADGRTMAVGPIGAWPGVDQGIAVVTATGVLDTAFSSDGKDIQSLAAAGADNAGAAIPFADGRIAVVGFAVNGGNADPTAFVYEHGSGISDYANTVNDWDTASTTSMFGVCLKSVTGGTANWNSTGSCPTVDGTNWYALPTNAAAGTAKAAYTTVSSTTGMVATFSFGMRSAASSSAGTYFAPVVFQVDAPNV